jgi:hypothetical protein
MYSDLSSDQLQEIPNDSLDHQEPSEVEIASKVESEQLQEEEVFEDLGEN